jgi:hypothetical protein
MLYAVCGISVSRDQYAGKMDTEDTMQLQR